MPQPDLQKKICMLGAFASGKTSLVARFVRSIFSEEYHSTIGVKIDRKSVVTPTGREVDLMLWDIAGEDEFVTVKTSYVRGSAGYLLVVDGTRPSTVHAAWALRERVNREVGEIPYLLLLNKCDLTDQWVLEDSEVDALAADALTTLRTSAKTGECVEEAFVTLLEGINR